MKVAVIGGGVIGITTAYFLIQRGCSVQVFEAGSRVASLATSGNAGQLSYSFTDSLADPSLIKKIPLIMARLDPGLRVNPSLRPSFFGWALHFLRNCTESRSAENSTRLLKYALQSAALMQDFKKLIPSAFGETPAGKLVLLSTEPDTQQLERVALKQRLGSDIRLISVEEAVEVEPTIKNWRDQPVAAIYSAQDEVGDAEIFTNELAAVLVDQGARIHLSTAIKASKKLTKKGELCLDDLTDEFDAVVVCAGTESKQITAKSGIWLPTYPIAGYSLNLPLHAQSPRTSITALNQRLVFSRFKNSMRIAGFIDINGAKKKASSRLTYLRDTARNLCPDSAIYDQDKDIPGWMGYRCMTPSGVPLVGATAKPGVFVNTGHGMFGWTLSAATSVAVADAVTGNATASQISSNSNKTKLTT